ncbi:potassium channel family protein [Mobiluncus curtisii]|uniref:potassium channel family protein n=1 Tax=Mobiluncus curtisii TaxID=2051 RepID=UPI0014703E89|nr:TrkA family potassium uptake protein [Mobiluncus curtisii]NMW46366.1 TrkA family potassium uptake protein [Mobiluncus curtisii]
MLIVIAGAGSIGRSIARELLARGHQVTIADSSPEAMKVSSVPEANWILGDLSTPETMEQAGAAQADVVVASTGNDQANLVIALLAKTQFGVPRVVGRINNPKNEWMFNESWGVDVPISTPRMMTALVEEVLSVGTLVPIFRFNNSHNGLFSIVLSADSPVLGRNPGEIEWPTGVLLTAVMQDGTALAPHLVASLRASDQLLFLFPEQNEEAIAQVGKLLTVTDAADSASAVGGVGSVGVGGTDASETGVEELPVSATQQEPTQVERHGE